MILTQPQVVVCLSWFCGEGGGGGGKRGGLKEGAGWVLSFVAFTFFFSKGDHDGAIKQYIKTIGHLEPSYVIRKVKLANATTIVVSRKVSILGIF